MGTTSFRPKFISQPAAGGNTGSTSEDFVYMLLSTKVRHHLYLSELTLISKELLASLRNWQQRVNYVCNGNFPNMATVTQNLLSQVVYACQRRNSYGYLHTVNESKATFSFSH